MSCGHPSYMHDSQGNCIVGCDCRLKVKSGERTVTLPATLRAREKIEIQNCSNASITIAAPRLQLTDDERGIVVQALQREADRKQHAAKTYIGSSRMEEDIRTHLYREAEAWRQLARKIEEGK